uniref:Crp/Fnr family transcriptional regulator n=1 Tax=Schlesneria paludicola TaxID=360056 RepID=A0A7C2PA14_9PLAN
MEERLWILKRCQLFQSLEAEHFALLERRARMRSFPKGSQVYLPSDSAEGVLLLAEGRIRLSSYTPDGKQAVLGFIEPGELFGELALFDPRQREENAEAILKSQVIWIPADDLQIVMERVPALAFGVTRLIGFRRRRVERRLKSLLFRSSRDRILALLCELAEQYGRQESGGVLIALPLSHQDLANIIGSTRETVTVLLGELQLEGLLQVGRKRILVRAPARLAALVDGNGHSCEPPTEPAPGFKPVAAPRPVS